MPNASYEEAYKEALALAPSNVVYLHTLQIHHEDIEEDRFLVRDRVGHTLHIEGGVPKAFEACGFRFSLPTQDAEGAPQMTLGIDDVDGEVSDYLKSVLESQTPIEITYRPYLAQSPTIPQMNPPLVLYLRRASKKGPEVIGVATFADVVNKKFLTELYTRERFPSLANF